MPKRPDAARVRAAVAAGDPPTSARNPDDDMWHNEQHLRKLVAGVGEPEPGPTKLATDSQSARDVSYNPEHHDRMKHVQRRHFFVRDMVESLEIEVPFVRTDDNIADFFTKPLQGKKFHAMRRLIMNEPTPSGVDDAPALVAFLFRGERSRR